MAKFYCQCCGIDRSSVSSLTGGECRKNPNGKYHVLYEGIEKSRYTCKYCGIDRGSMNSLTGGECRKNPNGDNHIPAL